MIKKMIKMLDSSENMVMTMIMKKKIITIMMEITLMKINLKNLQKIQVRKREN